MSEQAIPPRRYQRGRPFTPEQRWAMIRLWASGVSADIVAEKYGCHEAYVRAAARRYGVKSCRRRGRPRK
jgi:hypothetical protein